MHWPDNVSFSRFRSSACVLNVRLDCSGRQRQSMAERRRSSRRRSSSRRRGSKSSLPHPGGRYRQLQVTSEKVTRHPAGTRTGRRRRKRRRPGPLRLRARRVSKRRKRARMDTRTQQLSSSGDACTFASLAESCDDVLCSIPGSRWPFLIQCVQATRATPELIHHKLSVQFIRLSMSASASYCPCELVGKLGRCDAA